MELLLAPLQRLLPQHQNREPWGEFSFDVVVHQSKSLLAEFEKEGAELAHELSAATTAGLNIGLPAKSHASQQCKVCGGTGSPDL